MKFLHLSVLTIGFFINILSGILAQSSILEKTENETITLKSGNFYGLERIFQKITNVNYQVSIQKTIRLFAQESTGGNYQGEIEFKIKKTSNDLKYRQFSIQKSLVPSFIGCKVWNNTDGSPQLVKYFKMISRKTDSRYEGKFDGYHSKPANNLKISVDNLILHYNSSTANALQQEMNHIDHYYDTKETLSHLQATLDAIKPNSLTQIEQNKEKLKHTKQKIAEADKLRYTLKLNQNDPADLLATLQKLRQTYETTNNEYQKALLNRHVSYYENALRLLQYGQISEGIRFLNLAIEANPNYAPAQLTLAKLKLKNKKLDDCQANIQVLQKLQQLSSTDIQTRNEIHSFYRDIYSKYLERGDHKLTEKDYEDALEDYQEAQKIASFMGSSRNLYKNKTVHRIKQLKTKQFEDITKRADNQITGSNLTESYQLLLEAEEFKEDNEDFITEDTPLNQAYQKLYRKTLEQADNRIYDRNYTEALNSIELAEKICQKGVLSNNCQTETNQYIRKVKIKQFENIIIDARNQMRNDNFDGAERTLEEAQNFQNRNRDFIQDDAILQNAWKTLFEYNLLKIKSLISEKKYNKAIDKLEDLKQRLRRYPNINLESDIKNLSQEAYSGRYEQDFQEAQNSRKSKNYTKALQQLYHLENDGKRYNEFILDFKKSQIRVEYVLLLNGFIQEAEAANASQNFEQALTQLDKANELINFQYSEKQRINKNYFTAWFGIGIQYKNYQHYEKAVDAFEEAGNFAQNQAFSNASESVQKAHSQKLKMIKLWIDKNLQIASRKINPQEIHTAKKLVQQVSELSKKYYFKLSDEVKKHHADLTERIRLEECRIAKNAYRSALEMAQNQIENQLFAQVLETLESTIQSAKNITACSVQTSEANQLLQKYKDAGVYQQALNMANINLQNSDFKSFETEYLKAENNFGTQNLKRFGLEHTNFKNFVLQENRLELWHFLAVRYSDIDLKFTQKLLNQLTRKNYDKYSMRNLGKEIARKDFAKSSDKKAKRLVEKYNFSKYGFKQFRKGYLQAWKELD